MGWPGRAQRDDKPFPAAVFFYSRDRVGEHPERHLHGYAGILQVLDAARHICDVRVITISPGMVTRHAAAGGAFPADVDFLNREISGFFDRVTEGQRIK